MKPLIVIDGTDGSGKRTQKDKLFWYLRDKGVPVEGISFPRYEDTFFGHFLRKCLDGLHGDFLHADPRLASIPYAADRFESAPKIRRALASGYVVICDRYVSANQIHQGGKFADERERATYLTWLDELEYGVFGSPQPDVSIYLDVPAEVSARLMQGRQGSIDIAESDLEHQRNSVASAHWLIQRRPDKWIHIQCAPHGEMRTPEDIHYELVQQLAERGMVPPLDERRRE